MGRTIAACALIAALLAASVLAPGLPLLAYALAGRAPGSSRGAAAAAAALSAGARLGGPAASAAGDGGGGAGAGPGGGGGGGGGGGAAGEGAPPSGRRGRFDARDVNGGAGLVGAYKRLRRRPGRAGLDAAAAACGVRVGAGGASAASPASSSLALYPACAAWHTSAAIAERNITLILVGNEAYQQFPLLGYGGIETSVEIIAAALHAFAVPFAVITPHRADPPPYPFPIYDTTIFSNGKGDTRSTFVREALRILRDLAAAAPPPPSPPPAAADAASGPPAAFFLWGQSIWAQAFAMAPGVALAVVTHHDGSKPPKETWDFGLHAVRHRFLSHDQRSRWVPVGSAASNATRVVPHGLPPEDFFTCRNEGYFLWVASLDWGWEQKGLDIVVELARRRPRRQFHVYGGAVLRFDLVERAKEVAKQLPNFLYRGTLKRGPAHRAAFCGAAAFLMPTQADIGESFGMTVIEALSKGVPVIASTSAAVPELLGIPFGSPRVGHTRVGSVCTGADQYEAAIDHWDNRSAETSAEIQAYAASRFTAGAVVDALLAYTLDSAVEVGALE